MPPLEPADAHRCRAASGWLELGLVTEAMAEMDQLSRAALEHPEVLGLRWRLHAHQREWDQALAVAGRLVELAPDQPDGWIDRSYALHELRRTEEAREGLLSVCSRFARWVTVPYNLACYACQLGAMTEARQWLAKAARLRGLKAIRAMALEDRDLEPLWPEIRLWPIEEDAERA